MISRIANDSHFIQRLIACAAQEGIDHPETWVQANRWRLVTDSQMVADYRYAVETDKRDPGLLEDVVNDNKILSIVQTVKNELDAERLNPA